MSEKQANVSLDARSGELMQIALSALVPSPVNVRKTGGGDVAGLKASIEAQGVLQNLIVVPAPASKRRRAEQYEVVGGMRRLKALKELAEEGKIASDEPILCRVKASHAAALASLTENAQREAMHPADEFDAFQALVSAGHSVEDVALQFGTSVMTVKRRLKLARLHPELLKLYREDGIHLDQLMALAVSDDPQAQWDLWQRTPEWNRTASALRYALIRDDIDVSDRRMLLVGLPAYEAAGGRVRRDLFSTDDEGTVQDVDLLQRLVDDRLQAAMEAVRGEGWSWVEYREQVSSYDLREFERCPKSERAASKEEARQRNALDKQLAQLEHQAEKLGDAEDDEGELDKIEQQIEAVHEAIAGLEQARVVYDAEAMASAGVILSIGRQGDIETHRGLVRRVAKRAGQGDGGAVVGEREDSAPAPKARPDHSAALMLDLTARQTLAVRASLLDQPRVAMSALLHCLVQRLQDGFHGVPETVVRLVPNAPDAGLKPAQEDGDRAWTLIEEQRRAWGDRMPGNPKALLPWLMALDDSERLDLLALCVALTVDDVRDFERETAMRPLAEALSLDMADWWEPTAQGYFERVTKDAILAAISEGAGPEAAARIKGVSKAELARVAERELKGKRWLPSPLRHATEVKAVD